MANWDFLYQLTITQSVTDKSELGNPQLEPLSQAIKSFVKLIEKSREQRRNLALEHAANCLPISILSNKESLSPNNFTPT